MKRKNLITRWSILIGLFFLLLNPLPGSAATVLFFDDFNGENGGVAEPSTCNYTTFIKWNVTRGTVDLIGNGYWDFYPGNGLYVDLDGSTDASGQMTSKTSFTLTPGITYILEYDLSGNLRGAPANTVEVSLGIGGFIVTRVLATEARLTHFTDTFTVASQVSGNLIFDQIDGNNNNRGAILDNVQLSAVPLPSALLLLGSGLMCLAAYQRRKSASRS